MGSGTRHEEILWHPIHRDCGWLRHSPCLAELREEIEDLEWATALQDKLIWRSSRIIHPVLVHSKLDGRGSLGVDKRFNNKRCVFGYS
jgi:hypothetical protein